MRRCTLSRLLKLRTAVAATAVASLALGGCTIGLDGDSASTALDDEAGAPNPTLPSEAEDTSALPSELVTAVEKVEREFGGSAGIALATPGAKPNAVSAGSFRIGPAWSTSKVPIAVAVVRQGGMNELVEAAITISDNDSAETMWNSLGDMASETTNAILREGGDNNTYFQSQRLRSEFSAFGQTQWALPDQATFGANLQCIEAGPEVADLMGQIAEEQSYGLGEIAGAHFKGGWGPDDAGIYLVRQFGFIPGKEPGTFVGVAIAAVPDDGSYDTGQQMLNSLAKAISAAGGSVAAHAGSC